MKKHNFIFIKDVIDAKPVAVKMFHDEELTKLIKLVNIYDLN